MPQAGGAGKGLGLLPGALYISGMTSVLRSLLLAAAIGLGACSAAGGADLRATSLPLDPDRPERVELGALRFAGGLRLSGGSEFGGLSGMALSSDGRTLTAISDRGSWVRLALDEESHRLVGARLLASGPLLGLDGKPLSGKMADAEELAASPWSTGWVVSFERRHRLWRYGDLKGPAYAVKGPEDLGRLPANGGIEAMAALPDGRLLLVAEEGGADSSPAWIGRPGDWQKFEIALVNDFRPTGAAGLPNGDVVLLQRRFTLIDGVAARLVRLPADQMAAGARLAGQELARLQPPLLVDNMEAVVARPMPDGSGVRLFLLSDDNFNLMQFTLLLAFDLLSDEGT